MSSTPDIQQPQVPNTNVPPSPSSPAQMSDADLYSIVVTLAIGLGLAVLASIATHHVSQNASTTWVIWLAVSVGGLGGLAHEFAQSGGKILFFERKEDGFYIGSTAGVVLGAVAGLLAVQGLLVHPAAQQSLAAGATKPQQPDAIQLIYTAFLAGLALKGVAEAAGGQVFLPA